MIFFRFRFYQYTTQYTIQMPEMLNLIWCVFDIYMKNHGIYHVVQKDYYEIHDTATNVCENDVPYQ